MTAQRERNALKPCILRAICVALIVGPIIALINHGDTIWTGTTTQGDLFKIIVTFCVPFCVSLTSSLLAIRQSVH